MTPQSVRQACKDRGCRITWAFSPRGHDDDNPAPHVEVDHVTATTSGSQVVVMRCFDGEIIKRVGDDRYDWTDEQIAAVSAWVAALHRMPLDEIP